MRPLKYGISISLDVDIIERVKVLSEKNDRSVSSYINLVLRRHFNMLAYEKEEDKKGRKNNDQ